MRFKNIFLLPVFALLALTARAQDFALKQLENSPRHHEWVELNSGGRTLHNFVAYPEKSENAPVVIVIHENRGLNDWARSFTDQLAAEGFIVIAPDLLSGYSDDVKKTSDFVSADAARQGIYALDQNQITGDLNKVFEYAKSIPAANGKVAVAGFCWGGAQSWRYAANNPNLDAALVFYGTSPDDEVLKEINVPVYGFYGGADQRVNATIAPAEKALTSFGKIFDYQVYDGAGHAYMRSGDNPEETGPNKAARDSSWVRMLSILKNMDE